MWEKGKKYHEICCPDRGDMFQNLQTQELNSYLHAEMDIFQSGSAADLLAGPGSALLQDISSLQFALPAVQGTQVPQGGVNCGAGRRKRKNALNFHTSNRRYFTRQILRDAR